MSEKRFTIDKIFKEYPKLRDNETECFYHLVDNERNAEIFCERLNNLVEENEQLRNELTFLNKVISFFADNPMTKYSSKSELLEEMKLLEKMGLI